MKATCPFFLALIVSCASPEVEEKGTDWKSIERDLQARLITSPDSSVIDLPEGNYMFTRSLLIDNKKNLTIRGKGIDKTILSFEMQEEGAEGIKVANGTNITFEDFTIQNARGDNIKVTDTRGIVFRRVKSQTGLYLTFDETDPYKLGIYKPPVAAGRGSGGLKYSIVPGKPEESILIHRIESLDPGAMMPEVGRKVRHEEGIELVREWVLALSGKKESF